MRWLIPSGLLLASLTGCSPSKDYIGDDNDDGEWSDNTCNGDLNITGSFEMDESEFAIDEVQGGGLQFSTEHKMDVDLFEAGCISDIDLQLEQGGLGCRINLAFVATGEGTFALSSFLFSADSFCPSFPDSLEGDYSIAAPIPLTVSGIPDQVDLVSGIEERVCVDGTGFQFSATGELLLLNGSITRPFSLNLRLDGNYWSSGSPTANCGPGASSAEDEPTDEAESGAPGGDDGGGDSAGGPDADDETEMESLVEDIQVRCDAGSWDYQIATAISTESASFTVRETGSDTSPNPEEIHTLTMSGSSASGGEVYERNLLLVDGYYFEDVASQFACIDGSNDNLTWTVDFFSDAGRTTPVGCVTWGHDPSVFETAGCEVYGR